MTESVQQIQEYMSYVIRGMWMYNKLTMHIHVYITQVFVICLLKSRKNKQNKKYFSFHQIEEKEAIEIEIT